MADCLFCKIIRKEMKSQIEFEDESTVIIRDINPQAPNHVLVIPKKHIDKISSISQADIAEVGKIIHEAKQFAAKNGWDHYRLVFNNGEEAGQSVFHIHLHLLSGRVMSWPPG